MKTFKNVTEWLATNPSEDEQKKVINLITKVLVSQTRREVYELTRYLRKLQSSQNNLKKLGYDLNESAQKAIVKTKSQIAELSKNLPAPQKKVVKAKDVKVDAEVKETVEA
jgi:replicative DNA helicase